MILGPTSHEAWMKLPMLLLLAYKAEGTSEENGPRNHRDKCTEVWVFFYLFPCKPLRTPDMFVSPLQQLSIVQ